MSTAISTGWLRFKTFALLAILLGILGGSAYAANQLLAGSGDDDVLFSACASQNHLRLVEHGDDCRNNEKLVQLKKSELKGDPGEPGAQGVPGINCWDSNENHEKDPAEDTNDDGEVDVRDCQVMVVATATATASPTSTQPPTPGSGFASVAVAEVAGPNGLNSAGSPELIHYWGIGETLFLRAEDDTSTPWLATGFEVDSDLSGARLFIRDGVQFQRGFGELTAEDVAWSMNDANAATNPGSSHGQAGDFNGLWGEWIAVNDSTIAFEFANFDSTWKDDFLNQSGQSFSVFSKRAFDENGAEYSRQNIIATGPFNVESWDANDQLTLVSRYAGGGQHYLPELTPKTARVQFLEVEDPNLRASLLRNGQVDIAEIEADLVSFVSEVDFAETGGGDAVQLGVFFSGNLWERVSAQDGSPLPFPSTFVHDIPWIGSPGRHDGGEPSDDMEQARLIRRALAIAIDRDEVNRSLLDGRGIPVHVEYFSTLHPNWDSRWEYPHDPDEARRILSEEIVADYQQGLADTSDENLNGNAFEVSIYAGPELGGHPFFTGYVADAVASYWADLGLKTNTLKFSYQTFRPGVVGRTNVHPWVTSCDKGRESNPWHFPKGLVQTSLTRGGFSCGFESPEILEFYQRMAVAADQVTATIAANDYLDYVYFWNLQPGVVAVPLPVYLNRSTIASWDMDRSPASRTNNPWNIVMK